MLLEILSLLFYIFAALKLMGREDEIPGLDKIKDLLNLNEETTEAEAE